MTLSKYIEDIIVSEVSYYLSYANFLQYKKWEARSIIYKV
jgi:hypothetical protein